MRFSILGLLLLPILAACSSTQPMQHSLPFEITEKSSLATHLWTQKVPGLVTDLRVARDGSALAVATIPNPDVRGGAGDPQIVHFGPTGDRNWIFPLKAKTKDLAIADDGSLVVVSSYDQKVTAINKQGKRVWTYTSICRPIVLTRLKRVICFYNDDSNPKVAFDLLDWSGNRLLRFPAEREVLLMRASADEKSIFLAFTGGHLVHLDENFQLVWKGLVPGEIVDMAPAGGTAQSVAILYYVFEPPASNSRGHHRLLSLSREGKRIQEITLDHHTERVSLTEDGQAAVIYGNGPLGQFLAYYRGIFGTDRAQRTWFYRDQHHADYSSPVIVAPEFLTVGFEDVYTSPQKVRRSHLFSFNLDGEVGWYLPLQTEDGAYLYDQSPKAKNRFMAVATDLGYLSGYELN